MNLLLQSVAWCLHTIFGQTIHPEQLAFFVGLYISLAGAYLFKHKVQHSTLPVENQLYLVGVFGVWLYYFLWGWFVILPVLEVAVCYVILRKLSVRSSSKFIFCFSMSLLSLCHIAMVYFRYVSFEEEHSADFTGPIMVITQRITSLAFSCKDGQNEEKISDNQKKYSIRKIPTFPEYFAYMFNFFGVMCGPFVFYNDIMPHLSKKKSLKKIEEETAITNPPVKVVCSKVFLSMAFIFLYWVGSTALPVRRNITIISKCSSAVVTVWGEHFIETSSVFYRIFHVYLSLFLARSKYYGAWLFSDAIHNAAGVGFNGHREDGKPRWDLVSNIKIPNIEFATGMKSYIDNWNIMTVKWIRHVSYDRLHPKYRTLSSFLLSALWHGFFPGYYIMFLTGHIFLLVQRKTRHVIRPFFQTSTPRYYLYEAFTLLTTQLAIAYCALSFTILDWTGSIEFYKSFWFAGHFIAIFLLVVLPNRKSPSTHTLKEKELSNGANHSVQAENTVPNFQNHSVMNGRADLRRR